MSTQDKEVLPQGDRCEEGSPQEMSCPVRGDPCFHHMAPVQALQCQYIETMMC